MNVQFDKNKGYNWLKASNNQMQDDESSNHTNTTLQDYQVNDVAQSQKVKRSIRAKTKLVRITNYERFSEQALCENGDLIEESTTTECEPTNLN